VKNAKPHDVENKKKFKNVPLGYDRSAIHPDVPTSHKFYCMHPLISLEFCPTPINSNLIRV